MQITTDIRKALGEKARTERDKAVAKEEAARKALLEVVTSDSYNSFLHSWQPSTSPVAEAEVPLALSITSKRCLPVLVLNCHRFAYAASVSQVRLPKKALNAVSVLSLLVAAPRSASLLHYVLHELLCICCRRPRPRTRMGMKPHRRR